MPTAQHPARRRDGFAGLRLVSELRPEAEPEPVSFTVQILIDENGRASIEWDPKTPDVVRYLDDVSEVITAAVRAMRSDQDVESWVQRAFENRRAFRRNVEEREAEFERTHPWVCACGKRAKTSAGLDSHVRAGDPRCGRG